MKTLLIDAVKLSSKLQKYFQDQNPGKQVEYYCWTEEYEGREDWDGYVPKYHRLTGRMIVIEKIDIFGDIETSKDEKELDQDQIYLDIKEMLDDFFSKNNVDLEVYSVSPHEKSINIELREHEKVKEFVKK